MEIYLIVNTINGKQYIGQTTLSLEKRVYFYHLHHAYPEEGRPYPIERAMRKHGFENFSFETLRECSSQKALDYWERYYIKKLGTKVTNGYNIQDGGKRGKRGKQRKRTEPSRETIYERLVLRRYKKLQRKRTQFLKMEHLKFSRLEEQKERETRVVQYEKKRERETFPNETSRARWYRKWLAKDPGILREPLRY